MTYPRSSQLCSATPQRRKTRKSASGILAKASLMFVYVHAVVRMSIGALDDARTRARFTILGIAELRPQIGNFQPCLSLTAAHRL